MDIMLMFNSSCLIKKRKSVYGVRKREQSEEKNGGENWKLVIKLVQKAEEETRDENRVRRKD